MSSNQFHSQRANRLVLFVGIVIRCFSDSERILLFFAMNKLLFKWHLTLSPTKTYGVL